jgi:hypothetical protein
MQTNLPQQITEERVRITALDSELDSRRTPYLKSQLQRAVHLLDDANYALQMEANAGARYKGVWVGLAGTLLQTSVQLRQKVQELIDKYGGPSNVTEVG